MGGRRSRLERGEDEGEGFQTRYGPSTWVTGQTGDIGDSSAGSWVRGRWDRGDGRSTRPVSRRSVGGDSSAGTSARDGFETGDWCAGRSVTSGSETGDHESGGGTGGVREKGH